MRLATMEEMEYLSNHQGGGCDARLVREMSRQLDALRRFDQYCAADWRPDRSRAVSKKGKSLGE